MKIVDIFPNVLTQELYAVSLQTLPCYCGELHSTFSCLVHSPNLFSSPFGSLFFIKFVDFFSKYFNAELAIFFIRFDDI